MDRRQIVTSFAGIVLCLTMLATASTRARTQTRTNHSIAKQKARPIPAPQPQRIYRISEPADSAVRNPAYLNLVVTPHLLLVESYDLPARRYVALDRSAGTELWHKENTENKAAGEQTEWILVGVARSTTANEVVVFQQSLLVRQDKGFSRVQTSILQGVEALTGKALWQIPLTASRAEETLIPVGVFGSVVVCTYPQEVPTEYPGISRQVRENVGRVDFLAGFTGDRMDPASEQGKAALQFAAKQSHSPLAFLERSYPHYLLHLDSGTVTRLPVSGNAEFAGVSKTGGTSRNVLTLVVTDDDGVGHSQWPNYVAALDSTGHKAWEFPQTLIFPGTGAVSPEEERRSYETIGRMLVVPEADIVLATGSKHALYGLQASTGKVRWQTPPDSLDALALAAYGKGAFILAGRREYLSRSLAYIDATTGKWRWLTGLPTSQSIVIDGDELFVMVGSDQVYAYSCPLLLAAKQKQ